MGTKSWRKFAALSVVTLLLIMGIVFFASYFVCRSIQIENLKDFQAEIPNMVESINRVLSDYEEFYGANALGRARLGVKIYGEESGLTNEEILENVRTVIKAASVSLVDEKRQLLSTTGPVSREEIFSACLETLEPETYHLEFYPALSDIGKETDAADGKFFILLPIPGNTKQSLVFEFSCDAILKEYNAFDGWSGLFEPIISGTNSTAYVRTGSKVTAYPTNDLMSDQAARLNDELMNIFQNSGSFRDIGDGLSSRDIKLLGERYLAVLSHAPDEDMDILMTVPLKQVINNGFYIAAVITAIIGWSMMLIRIYIFRCVVPKNDEELPKNISLKELVRETWPGMAVVLFVTILFSSMLLVLENRTNITVKAQYRRESLQQSINQGKNLEKKIRSAYRDTMIEAAQILADYLKAHPEQQTAAGLKDLNRIVEIDYLMLFDRNGDEKFASNSYTGFSVGNNLSEDYQAVLLGYPHMVVGPEADSYTGRMQLGAAVLMTDSDGQQDGFLLGVCNAGELSDFIKRVSYENTVNNRIVPKGQIAAAINSETGLFVAHTDPHMIGLSAENVMPDFKPGSNFEGFAKYNGLDMCISASTSDGKTLLYMIPERTRTYEDAVGLPVILAAAVLLILTLIFYPNAALLIAQAIQEAKIRRNEKTDRLSLIRVFTDGYEVYLALFTLFVLITASNGWWSTFDYILSGLWSKGLNLFSAWAILFLLIVTFFCEYLVRVVLNLLESRLSPRAKSITRLVKSLIFYTAYIFLFFIVLDMLGTNATAMLASAGILSIAVGMGAKSMAEDLLAGFFMILEGTVRLGDHVGVGSVSGTVTNMGIRTTEITDDQGNVVMLNNSKVTAVRNMSRKQEQEEPENSSEKVA